MKQAKAESKAGNEVGWEHIHHLRHDRTLQTRRLRQAQPDVASPTAISATVARKVETRLASRPACVFFAASIETSMHVLLEREDISIHVLAKPQPKAGANSNAEPGNAGLNLPLRCYRRSPTDSLVIARGAA
jgi:hypothetical protein